MTKILTTLLTTASILTLIYAYTLTLYISPETVLKSLKALNIVP